MNGLLKNMKEKNVSRHSMIGMIQLGKRAVRNTLVLLGLLLSLLGVNATAMASVTVSLTSPVDNTVSQAPGSFTLVATASSTTSAITQVDFYNGTTLLGTATAEPYGFTWSNVPAGSYSLTAVATDGNGATMTSVPVSVIANAAPTASLTSPAANAVSVTPGSFTLSANAADPDGTIAKVEFYANNGTANTLIGTATTAPYSFSWTNVAAGNYTITAVATDNLGAATTSAAVSVTADAVPTVSLNSPLANAVSVAPGSFTLTASTASTTSTITKVDFYANNGTSNTLIGTATAAPYSFTWSNVPAGSYSLTAVATDALGITATSVAVNVNSDQAPAVTLTSPAMGAQITSPNSFTLTATASSVTSTIVKVDFYANNGMSNTLVGTVAAAPYNFTWSNVPVGSYSLTAIATDAFGTATTSAATSVTAIANVPPAVSLTSPANGATVTAPGSFTLTATASSTTSAIAKVDFYANNGTTNLLVGTATTAPYSFTWSNVALGSYTLSAVATDTLNATTTSTAVTVTVNTGIAQAHYIYTDHLDTARLITDTNGNVVWEWQNTDPFGNNPPNENPSGLGTFEQPLRLKGMVADKETGLFYNVNRDYDPANGGRYIESDPIGLRGGINTYQFVNSNPLSYVDPLGLSYLLYNNGTQTLYVLDGKGNIIKTFDAANNAQTGSRGPWPEGTYNIQYFVFRPDDSPNSKFGSNGNTVFDLPGCKGCGVHSGHRDDLDKAKRKGYKYATDGCIRTTDDATSLIQKLENSDDPVESLTVVR